MDKREKYSIIALTALVAIVTVLKVRGHPSVAEPSTLGGVDESAAGGGNSQNQFELPYSYSTPGIADNPITLNGGAPFQSTINVEVNPSYLGTLSQDYIPMFGFIGMGSTGGPGTLNGPAPAPATFVSAPAANGTPYAPPRAFAQPSPFLVGGSGGSGPAVNSGLFRPVMGG